MAQWAAEGGGLRRWRWRLRGATMWPAFVPCLAADVVILWRLPVAGDRPDFGAGLIVGCALDLATVAAVAPLAGMLLRRRRPDLPRVVAVDRAGTAGLLMLTVVLLALGLAHRPAVTGTRREDRAARAALRAYVIATAPRYRAGLSRLDSVALGAGLYRACIPGPARAPDLCLYLDASRTPVLVHRDPDVAPNLRLFNGRDPGT